FANSQSSRMTKGASGAERKKFGTRPKRGDLAFEVFLAGVSGFRIWKKRNYRHGSHHPHESTKHMSELKAGSVQNCTPRRCRTITSMSALACFAASSRTFPEFPKPIALRRWKRHPRRTYVSLTSQR